MCVLYVSEFQSDDGQCPRNAFMLLDFGLMSGEARGMFICLCYVIIYMSFLICLYVYRALLDARWGTMPNFSAMPGGARYWTLSYAERGPMKRARPMICFYVIR